jgi:hypothetical protein
MSQNKTLIAVVVCVVIVLILFVWTLSYYKKNGASPNNIISESLTSIVKSTARTYDDYFKTPAQMYEKTIGYINDKTAQTTLAKALKREQMYLKNQMGQGISKTNYPDAVNNAFTLGNLYQYNIAPNTHNPDDINAVGVYYGRALNRLVQNPQEIQNPEFMIDRIEDYYDNYIAEHLINPTAETAQNLQDFGAALGTLQNRNGFNQIREVVALARRNNANVRAETVVADPNMPYTRRKIPRDPGRRHGTDTPVQAAREIYYDIQDVRNDPQNVHETNVVHELKQLYEKIQNKNAVEEQILGTAMADIRDVRASIDRLTDHGKKQNALKALDMMLKQNFVSSLDTNETEVLSNVWKRIHSADNTEQRENLRDSLVNSLSECVEKDYNGNGQLVCTTGRVSRVLNSLTLIDNDPNINKPVMTSEILRNEVFGKTYNILQTELAKAEPDVQRMYNGLPGDDAPDLRARVEKFEGDVKNMIETTVRETYPDAKPEVLTNLIMEAQAGV